MNIVVYLCKCGNNIAGHLDVDALARSAGELAEDVETVTVDFLCSEEGRAFLTDDLQVRRAERVVVAACSPRDHEHTFRRIMEKSSRNPYLMQMVNIREQVAWVTSDPEQARAKSLALINGALHRVVLHEALPERELEISTDTLILGAGPAGLKCALALAEAGRGVVLVEKSPAIGGKPVLYEEIAPNLECGPCLLEPLMEDLLHGKDAERIELLTLAELHEVKGSCGNFLVRIRRSPRRIDPAVCIGCQECLAPCPVSAPDCSDYMVGLADKNAISFAYPGVLPNAPYVDGELCLRSRGRECTACLDACPMAGAIRLEEEETFLERKVGAIVLATGAGLYDPGKIPGLAYGRLPDVVTSLEFERLLAANGPSGGQLLTRAGTAPESICIIHCVGSLEPAHIPYCSGVCCGYALKFSQMLADKIPGAVITHLYKELVLPGKFSRTLHAKVLNRPLTSFQRFFSINDLRITGGAAGPKTVRWPDGEVKADLVVLCPPMVPAAGAEKLSGLLEADLDRSGFFEEAGERLDSARGKTKGIFLAGSCQSPGDIREAINQGMAAAGYVLSSLVAGRNLKISPVVARVTDERCSGCGVCRAACSFKAIDIVPENGKSRVNDVLCQGCGTCVAACPAGAMVGCHYSREQLLAELEGVLA